MKSPLTFLMAAKRSELAGLRRLALTSELVSAIGRLVHALQRERGLSSLYLGSHGQQWRGERLQQVAAGDEVEAAVRQALDQLDTDDAHSGHRTRLFGRIAYALQGLAALPHLRERVQALDWTPARATAAYVRIVNALLAVVFEAADSAWDPGISRHLVATFNFLQGKEFAGQERATGSALFAAGRADADSQQRLLHLIESQERCLQVFAEFAGRELCAAWDGAQRAEHLLPLERMRRLLCAAGAQATLDPGLSQAWFDACTVRLEAMHTVENALARQLQALCEQRREAAERDLAALARMNDDLQRQPPRAVLPADADFFGEDAAGQPLPLSITHPGQACTTPVERSILELVRDQDQRLQRMSEELDTVRASLNERKTIERAKGLLMAHRQLSEEQAHKTMRQMAMNQNRRLVDVAQAVLAMADVLPAGRA